MRDLALDEMRGFAILMMIFFHFIYDLNYFGFTDIALFKDTIYILWRYIIVSLFLISVGITLVIRYKKVTLKMFAIRLMKIALVALAISLITYFAFPQQWIFFGILHLILVASFISFFFIDYPRLALFTAFLIFVFNFFQIINFSWLYFDFLPKNSLDFYPLLPWLALVLIGIFIGYHPIYKKIFITRFSIIQYLGSHSMIFYITHQLVLFPLVGIIYYLNR
jgi:uncharacterized membrane protein